MSTNEPPLPTPDAGLLPAAIWWATQGYVVMPLKRGSNVPHLMLGKFGSFSTVGSVDPHQITEWWTADSMANIGIVTGQRSRLLVVDCDVKRGDGIAAFQQWCGSNDVDLSVVPSVDTPSGGRHYYFRLEVACKSPTGWLPNVDIRADGTQVATAPGVRPVKVNGGLAAPKGEVAEVFVPYRQNGPISAPPGCPQALLTDVSVNGGRFNPSTRHSTRGGYEVNVEYLIENGFDPGSRDRDCLRLARALFNMFHDEATVVGYTYKAWEKTQSPAGDPFTWQQAYKCVTQARRYYEEEMATVADLRRSIGGWL